jgi:hypothetical protein
MVSSYSLLDWSAAVMLLQVYSFLVLMYDVFCLFFTVLKAAAEAFYHIFIPPRQKSVAGEIVLVR